ncbi:hypothetical protein DMC30DRAFT_95801 [Rhodotorula diobovata]|uniref:Uncharacterized protein n=1 Tax=Rhodotorula diobovata TaxID=5288 RepID=A0A5C5FLI3_9BASI|nr:hypothetical protein DMC30DRAFT_95801 [Rhodotorula diobovata]
MPGVGIASRRAGAQLELRACCCRHRLRSTCGEVAAHIPPPPASLRHLSRRGDHDNGCALSTRADGPVECAASPTRGATVAPPVSVPPWFRSVLLPLLVPFLRPQASCLFAVETSTTARPRDPIREGTHLEETGDRFSCPPGTPSPRHVRACVRERARARASRSFHSFFLFHPSLRPRENADSFRPPRRPTHGLVQRARPPRQRSSRSLQARFCRRVGRFVGSCGLCCALSRALGPREGRRGREEAGHAEPGVGADVTRRGRTGA